MGFACPVCSDPQADAGHLANHLAFTAMLGDAAHEAWLEEHASGWGEMGEGELADTVVDHVEETEFPQVFEDTAGGLADDADPPSERSGALFDESGVGHGHDHASNSGQDAGHGQGSARDHQGSGGAHEPASGAARRPTGDDGPMDDEAAEILEEARELTRRMLEDGDEAGAAAAPDDDGRPGHDGGGDAEGEDHDHEANADSGGDADNNG